MPRQLPSVPEESTDSAAARRRNLYRTRSTWTRPSPNFGYVRQSRFSLPANARPSPRRRFRSSPSGYSSDSSHVSTDSYRSSDSAATAADFFGAYKLKEIAHRMVITDGYTQRLVQEFETGDSPESVLKPWFLELDVDWVLHIQEQQLQDKSAWALQELIKKWIRTLIIIVLYIKEHVQVDETAGLARFGKVSIAEMVVFLDAIVPALKTEMLQAVLDLYICVSGASNCMLMRPIVSQEVKSIFSDISSSLVGEEKKLREAISSTMKEVRSLMEDDDSWAIEIPRGRGGIHRNTRLMVDYIVSMRATRIATLHSAQIDNTRDLSVLINGTLDYLKDLLRRKSYLCSDSSLRYMSLLNNSYFVAQEFHTSQSSEVGMWGVSPRRPGGFEIPRECDTYVLCYVEDSWGRVMSRIPKLHFSGPLLRWINKSSLAKFQLAFHKTYQAQKFWKVHHPEIRSLLRRIITHRVILGYRNYLKEHPTLEKHASSRSNSPDILEEMLAELFEG